MMGMGMGMGGMGGMGSPMGMQQGGGYGGGAGGRGGMGAGYGGVQGRGGGGGGANGSMYGRSGMQDYAQQGYGGQQQGYAPAGYAARSAAPVGGGYSGVRYPAGYGGAAAGGAMNRGGAGSYQSADMYSQQVQPMGYYGYGFRFVRKCLFQFLSVSLCSSVVMIPPPTLFSNYHLRSLFQILYICFSLPSFSYSLLLFSTSLQVLLLDSLWEEDMEGKLAVAPVPQSREAQVKNEPTLPSY